MQSLTMGICFIDVWLIIRVLKFLLPRPVVTRLARLHASQFLIKDYWKSNFERLDLSLSILRGVT